MAYDTIGNIKIAGICCCVPDDCRKSEDFSDKMDDDKIKQFIETTGIVQTYQSVDLHTTTSDLCFAAAENLFEKLNVDRSTIDVLILVTQSADYVQPATACVLQHRLNLSVDCIAYDINLGCSGYPFGLHTAALYLQRENINRVLLLIGDSISTEENIDFGEISNIMLFGDAGCATLLEKDSSSVPFRFLLKTDGSGFRSIGTHYGGFRHGFGEKVRYRMNGADIFAFTLREVPKALKEFYSIFNVEQDEFDVFILHQANLMIVKNIVKKLKLSMDKVPISLDIYGNTSSATIPLGICDYFNRHCTEKRDSVKMIVSGYGIGLSWGVVSFNIDSDVCLPVITTNKSWDDGIDLNEEHN